MAMHKTLAMVLTILLLAGIAPTFANELEVTVLDQRSADTAQQLSAAKPICPTLQAVSASRNLLAMGGVSPSTYRAVRDAEEWLARCRADIEWHFSWLKQTPEGRAYLARIVAHVNERLRLECACEGAWVFDAGGASLPSIGPNGLATSPQTMSMMNPGCQANCTPLNQVSFDFSRLSASDRQLLINGGSLGLAILVGRGALTPAEALAIYSLIQALNSVFGRVEGAGGGGGGSGGGAGCDRPCGDGPP